MPFARSVVLHFPAEIHRAQGVSEVSPQLLQALDVEKIAAVQFLKNGQVRVTCKTAEYQRTTKYNRLGVCMSPDSMIQAQRKMGKQLEGKVKLWKKAIEKNKGALLLCEEIKEKHPPPHSNDMEIAFNLELGEEILQNYDNFTDEGYRLLKETVDTAREKLGDVSYTEECLSKASQDLHSAALPLYRYPLHHNRSIRLASFCKEKSIGSDEIM